MFATSIVDRLGKICKFQCQIFIKDPFICHHAVNTAVGWETHSTAIEIAIINTCSQIPAGGSLASQHLAKPKAHLQQPENKKSTRINCAVCWRLFRKVREINHYGFTVEADTKADDNQQSYAQRHVDWCVCVFVRFVGIVTLISESVECVGIGLL